MTDVSPVFIRRESTGAMVAAQLHDVVGERHIEDWIQRWRPARLAVIDQLRAAGAPVQDVLQSVHWNWAKKLDAVSGFLSHRSLCVVCEDMTQAFMRLDTTTKRARIPAQKGLNLVYVDYLETAPWNWTLPQGNQPQFGGIGSLLVNAAVRISIEEGFMGRLGLHSLPQADGFYHRIGMTDLGPDVTVQELKYYEFTPVAAKRFIDEVSGS